MKPKQHHTARFEGTLQVPCDVAWKNIGAFDWSPWFPEECVMREDGKVRSMGKDYTEELVDQNDKEHYYIYKVKALGLPYEPLEGRFGVESNGPAKALFVWKLDIVGTHEDVEMLEEQFASIFEAIHGVAHRQDVRQKTRVELELPVSAAHAWSKIGKFDYSKWFPLTVKISKTKKTRTVAINEEMVAETLVELNNDEHWYTYKSNTGEGKFGFKRIQNKFGVTPTGETSSTFYWEAEFSGAKEDGENLRREEFEWVLPIIQMTATEQ